MFPQKLMKYLLVFGVFMMLPFFSMGQQAAYFLFADKQFEGVDIYDVIQDNDFNYWIATDQGIYKHDGYRFEKIECEEMKSSSVFNLVKDQKGNIFCSNLNYQVFLLKGNSCNLFLDISDLNIRNDVNLVITPENHLMVVSNYVCVFDENKHLVANSRDYTNGILGVPFTLKDKTICIDYPQEDQLLLYKNKKFWLKPIERKKSDPKLLSSLYFFRLSNNSFCIDRFSKQIYSFNENALTLKYIKTLDAYLIPEYLRFYVGSDKLWLASSIAGLTVLDASLNNVFKEEKSYKNYFISDIYIDNENNVLISTFDQGILVIPDLKIPDVIPDLNTYKISRISENAQNGTLYFGTTEGQIIEAAGSKFKSISGKGLKVIETIYYWDRQKLVFSDDHGLSVYNLDNNKIERLKMGSLKDVCEIDSTTLAMAFNIGVSIVKYNRKSNVFSFEYVTKLRIRTNRIASQASHKLLYLATSEGLKTMDNKGVIKDLKVKGKDVFVSDFIEMGKFLLASTRKQGILVLENGKIVKQIRPVFNGSNLELYKIQFYNGKIYANTALGLVLVNLNGKVEQFFNKSVGISANKIVDFHILHDYIWIAQTRGMQKIKLNSLQERNTKPKILIASLQVNTKERSLGSHYFSSDERKFKFTLKVPTIKHRENIRYHYALFGNKDGWMSVPYENNEITYNALAPGKYTFVVKAENNGVFGKEVRYDFQIATPFYQTMWFLFLTIGGTLAVSFLIFRMLLKIQNRKARQLNELNISKLTAIQSQMNPHFIFNSLNSIQDLVLKGDIDNSYSFITKFSNLVRQTLNYSDKEFIDFEQEIKLIELYLSLEKLRFKENFNYYLEYDSIDFIQIPPMLIQPFIENALIHGLLHKEGEKKLTVRFFMETSLRCEIIDNGIGRAKAEEIKKRKHQQHDSFSIQAIKKRFEILQQHYKTEIGFYYEDLYQDGEAVGTKVHLTLPMKEL